MTLLLTGIRCDMPVGFMAGLGLIRIAPPTARLSWDATTKAARLDGIDRAELVEHLLVHMRDRHQGRELHLRDDVRGLTLDEFKRFVSDEDDATLQWARAFWRQDGDEVVPTNFCFTSGQQRMVLMARELAKTLNPPDAGKSRDTIREKFEEALFGPWLYRDQTPSWGWDPAAFRLGANTPKRPEAMPVEGVAAAYWLAWESLPLLPCIPGRGTLGFVKQRGGSKWTWASWAEPLPRAAVQAIVRRPSEALALGGTAFEADIVKSGYYQFFRPGRVAAMATG